MIAEAMQHLCWGDLFPVLIPVRRNGGTGDSMQGLWDLNKAADSTAPALSHKVLPLSFPLIKCFSSLL